MNTPARLGAYLLGLAVLFGGALGAGRAADAAGLTPQATPHTTVSPAPGEASVPEGLQVSNNGYTLTPRTTTVEPGRETDFRFTVTGPDGRPVTGYQVQHEKKLHFIVVSRDLGGFWHLHPREAGGGEWLLPMTLPAALDAFEADGELTEVLGKEFAAAYLAYKRDEVQRFSRTVTDWEFREYAYHL
ncbi:hypothetical protein ACFQ08_19000 [Streptosporangium algeriense]|uniref:GS catalytic domain-containing protein n=1 Tax=Streptosporangium algeriense TaxID=1682748 RepID=A0ABW3DV76_9ACTN